MMTMSLVHHARSELEIAGVEPEVAEGVIKMVEIFSSQGHSGTSAYYTIGIIETVMSFKNIAPLTDNPDEWMKIHHGFGDSGPERRPLWQSRRRADAFSHDGGKTYYCLDESKPKRWYRRSPAARRVLKVSEPHNG